MKHITTAPLWSLLLAAGMLVGNAHAGSTNSEPTGVAHSAKAKKKAHASGQTKFLPGSAETVKDRNNRLKRECKGQVNAGACSGYTN